MEVFKKNGTKERLFEMMKNVNKGLIKEDFDYASAERDVQGQQDLDQHQQDNDTSKELSILLKTSPEEFKNKISSMSYIPAFIKRGGMMDADLNPIGLGFRDLESAGLISTTETMTGLDSNSDGETEVSNMTALSEIPIYGVDTGKYYKKGETIQ